MSASPQLVETVKQYVKLDDEIKESKAEVKKANEELKKTKEALQDLMEKEGHTTLKINGNSISLSERETVKAVPRSRLLEIIEEQLDKDVAKKIFDTIESETERETKTSLRRSKSKK